MNKMNKETSIIVEKYQGMAYGETLWCKGDGESPTFFRIVDKNTKYVYSFGYNSKAEAERALILKLKELKR